MAVVVPTYACREIDRLSCGSSISETLSLYLTCKSGFPSLSICVRSDVGWKSRELSLMFFYLKKKEISIAFWDDNVFAKEWKISHQGPYF